MSCPKKIVILGPESTGKSTLTEMLAAHFHMPYVEEYARDYIAGLRREYREDDLLKIAKGQIKLENKRNTGSAPYLFCDTDLYVLKVWSEHKYGHCPLWILKQISRRNYDFYLLTDIDMPWEADPQREYPSPVMRSYFYAIYKDIVIQSGRPWAPVSGDPQQRLKEALQAIDRYFR